jgi:hypothetical protein
MTTLPGETIQPAETAFQRELRLFSQLFARLVDALLNRLFDLRPERAARRRAYLLVLFLLSGAVISLYYYPPAEWLSRIANILNILLSETSTPAQLQAAIAEFALFFRSVLQDPRILQYLPVFFAPFFIALQSAAIYLADVFELEDISIARNFIWSVALGGSSATIHIKQGGITEESRSSPAFRIGGPGNVVVALDSVALFERADGTPHVIGPTGQEPGGKAILEGFERFRGAFDLRDHFIELRDQSEETKAVASRSLDGIPIKAVDVRFMFSVFRGKNPQRTDNLPYPFAAGAVENLVYKAASRVTPGLPNPSTLNPLWYSTMAELIRKRLGEFMSNHKLTEYLASIGAPEVEKARTRESTIFREIQELTRTEDNLEQREIKPPPPFYTRPQIRDLFDRFAAEFTEEAHQSGVELHWIGVGTWEIPEETIPQKHLEAWKITQENLKNGSDDAIKKEEKKATIEKMKDIIAKVPAGAFEQITGVALSKKARAEQKEKEDKKKEEKPAEEKDAQQVMVEGMIQTLEGIHENVKEEKKKEESAGMKAQSHSHQIQSLLLAYRNHIQETIDFMRAKNEPVPENLIQAVTYINNLIAHWAGN